MPLMDFFRLAKSTDYQRLSEEMYEVNQKLKQERSNMTEATVKFSVGPHPEGDGAMIVFTQSNGMTSTVTMPSENVRLLIGLLEVVVPGDKE